MKIAIWHNLRSGGGKRALYYHVKGLVERGHHLEAWCPPTVDQNYLPLNPLIEEHTVPLDFYKPLSQPHLPETIKQCSLLIKKIKAVEKHCQACAEEINKRDFDLLFANSCIFFRTTAIGQYVNIPTILYLQEPYRRLYESLPKLPWLTLPSSPTKQNFLKYGKNYLKDLLKVQALRVQMTQEQKYAEAFDLILVNSLFSRESVLRAYGLDSKVCYLGIDSDSFHPTGVAKENFVVGLGGIYFGKGVDRAIKAIASIEREKRPPLVWIGNFANKHYQNQMENLAQSLQVDLEFKIFLSDNELVDFLNRATVLIYTSRLEPFGFAPLEANSCGTPVVAIAEGGIRETIKEDLNGFLVKDDDPHTLATAIVKLIDNPDLVQTMGQKARIEVQTNWTWETAVDRLEEYCEELIK